MSSYKSIELADASYNKVRYVKTIMREDVVIRN